MKLTLCERWMLWWGFPFVLNIRSKEVHSLRSKHQNCGLNLMAKKNKVYLSGSHAMRLLDKKKVDGCRWCLSEKNTG